MKAGRARLEELGDIGSGRDNHARNLGLRISW